MWGEGLFRRKGTTFVRHVPFSHGLPNSRRRSKQSKSGLRSEKATCEEKMERCREEEEETGRKKPGSRPKPPEDTGPEPGDQVNLANEESRIMFTSENGFQQTSDAQATVCMDSHLILEGYISQKQRQARACAGVSEAEPTARKCRMSGSIGC